MAQTLSKMILIWIQLSLGNITEGYIQKMRNVCSGVIKYKDLGVLRHCL